MRFAGSCLMMALALAGCDDSKQGRATLPGEPGGAAGRGGAAAGAAGAAGARQGTEASGAGRHSAGSGMTVGRGGAGPEDEQPADVAGGDAGEAAESSGGGGTNAGGGTAGGSAAGSPSGGGGGSQEGSECTPAASRRCNGTRDCADGSDEEDCAAYCEASGDRPFFCEADSKCLYDGQICDGAPDCSDESDEEDCEAYCEASGNRPFWCAADSSCFAEYQICDGQPDCSDGSDEEDCEAYCEASWVRTFYCAADSSCLYGSQACDGESNCSDGSDEEDCEASCEASGGRFCAAESRCLLSLDICDGESDCSDGSDEEDCEAYCVTSSRTFYCAADSSCLTERQVCDGVSDCTDGSDEEDCEAYCEPFMIRSFYCAAEDSCLDESYVCDGESDCTDGSDEEDCEAYCEASQTRSVFCAAENSCLAEDVICDGVVNCSDGSDESGCALMVVETSFSAPGCVAIAHTGTSLWCSVGTAELRQLSTSDGSQLGTISLPEPARAITGGGGMIYMLGATLHPYETDDVTSVAEGVYRKYGITETGSMDFSTDMVRVLGWGAGNYSGLAYDGTNLHYFMDYDGDFCYVVEAPTELNEWGERIDIQYSEDAPSSMAYDGERLVGTKNGELVIVRPNVRRGDMELLPIETPVANVTAVAYDGSHFWVLDASADVIYELSE